MARPRKYSKKRLQELAKRFEEYIQETDVPIIAEFAYQNGVPRQTLYDNEEFSTLLKICVDKKEAALERGGLSGELNSTMAIFSLKQLGWRDKQDIEHSGATETTINMNNLTEKELRRLASLDTSDEK